MFPFELDLVRVQELRLELEILEERRCLPDRPCDGAVGVPVHPIQEVQKGRQIRAIWTEMTVIVHVSRSLHRRGYTGVVEVIETPAIQVPLDVVCNPPRAVSAYPGFSPLAPDRLSEGQVILRFVPEVDDFGLWEELISAIRFKNDSILVYSTSERDVNMHLFSRA